MKYVAEIDKLLRESFEVFKEFVNNIAAEYDAENGAL